MLARILQVRFHRINIIEGIQTHWTLFVESRTLCLACVVHTIHFRPTTRALDSHSTGNEEQILLELGTLLEVRGSIVQLISSLQVTEKECE